MLALLQKVTWLVFSTKNSTQPSYLFILLFYLYKNPNGSQNILRDASFKEAIHFHLCYKSEIRNIEIGLSVLEGSIYPRWLQSDQCIIRYPIGSFWAEPYIFISVPSLVYFIVFAYALLPFHIFVFCYYKNASVSNCTLTKTHVRCNAMEKAQSRPCSAIL